MSKKRFGWVFLLLFFLAASLQAQINLLHSFAGATSDGAHPWGSLIFKGSTLYGMTSHGGTSDNGTIFKTNTNGTKFAVLHAFAGGAADGAIPCDSLILKGSTLYGMTERGGPSDLGTIFKVNTNGAGFALLHSFAGGASDGSLPSMANLILKGSTLYGMTPYGGTNGNGTIFRINTNGKGFELLHSFAGGVTDGQFPEGSLILSRSTLYGTTHNGGSSYNGTIFKVNTDGSGFMLLHSFTGATSDGAYPWRSLLLKGSTLYGITMDGGINDLGTVFKVNTNGTGFVLLHSFAGGASDGKYPLGSLILRGSILYGMTPDGGTNDMGTIFIINTDGTGFDLIYSFAGYPSDGAYPYGSLIEKGVKFYGITYGGGASDNGVIFSYSLKYGPAK